MNAAALPLAPLMLLQDSSTFWLPARSSSYASGVDWMFYVIYWVSVFFFVLVVALMVFFAWKYRKRPGHETGDSTLVHSTALEVTWTLIPLAIVIGLFWGGFKAFLVMSTPPSNAYEISVTAQKWKWLFEYPNGHISEELHVPVNTPVTMTMTSEDVIHSFYIPRFRIKKDVVPGRYAKVWFRATETGEVWLFCAEYCGTGHSDMITQVYVQDRNDFEKWLDQAGSMFDALPPAEAGEKMFKKYGCNQCHNIDGSANTGPPLNNVYGHEVAMADGTKITVDENYIRESILEPMKQVVAGYQPVMPTFQGKIKDKEITYLIAYLKSISDKTPASELQAVQQAPPAPPAEGAEPAEGATAPETGAAPDGEAAPPAERPADPAATPPAEGSGN